MKDVLFNALVLKAANWELDFHIGTDASQFGVGAVLYQKTAKDVICYIDFTAKSLNTAQANYLVLKCELLGVMFTLKR